ncbi:hypothetical protein FHK07_12085 [Listeria monocytogenes]|nr:hypothetical protein [Listeria monocytogenes]EJM6842214.1 hypothetical protein [Listeria monocytogenes]
MSNLSYDDQMKIVLSDIRDKKFVEEKILPELSRDDVADLINDCQQQGFISHTSLKQPLLTRYNHGGFLIHPTTFITRDGRKFIEEGDKSPSNTNNHYSIQTVYGAYFGNNGSVTNNFSGISIDDLKSFIDTISDSNDKEEGHQLVKTLETEEIKPGLLKRFDNLVGKYPNLSDLVGKIMMFQLFK